MSPEEKEIGRTIARSFKQRVCGFDLLRTNGKSYVCDVNGWSFVKGNARYYSDCSHEIIRLILQQFCPNYLKTLPSLNTIKYQVKCNFINNCRSNVCKTVREDREKTGRT